MRDYHWGVEMKTEDKENESKPSIEDTVKSDADLKDNAQKESKEENKEGAQKKKDKEAIAELVDSLQRMQAEFENYKKRVDKEKQEFVKYAKAELILKILNTIDTFEIALKNTADHEKFVKGMEMVHAQLISSLGSEGLKPINTVGKKFDPYLHEVMLKQKSDKESGFILEELQKGYLLNGKVLRFSKVKISEKDEQGKK